MGVTKQEDKWSKLRGVVPSNLGDRAFANSVPSFIFVVIKSKGIFSEHGVNIVRPDPYHKVSDVKSTLVI